MGGGIRSISTTHVTNTGNMSDGYTTEFWFKLIQRTGTSLFESQFFSIGYYDGSSLQLGVLYVLSNGIQFTANGQNISVTSNNLKMFEFMFIAIWVQNSTIHLLVSQNGINYLSSAMTSPPQIRGIRDVYILGSTVNATQFYIRDLFVSNGREYDEDNILVDSNNFFNHSCDSFTGVDIQFSVANVLLFSSVAEQSFNAGTGERFIGQMLGLDVSNKNWYLMFSTKWANWSLSSQSFFLYGDGYRGGTPYLLMNLYTGSNGTP